jgi:hypothetical protein
MIRNTVQKLLENNNKDDICKNLPFPYDKFQRMIRNRGQKLLGNRIKDDICKTPPFPSDKFQQKLLGTE